MIRNVADKDARALAEIYNYYVLNSIATFDEAAIHEEEMLQRIQDGIDKLPWLVYEENNKVLGYAYASKWKSRCAYAHTVESTVYVSHNAIGKGIGSVLYEALLERLKTNNMHTVIAGISLPNDSSIRLHEKYGFTKAGHFKEVGYKFEKWIDVGYWELILKK